MQGFDIISEKYREAGVSLDDIEYAITAVKFGSNPDHILENLKVGYKGVNDELANAFLRDLLIVNKIELKRKKRADLALAIFYSLIGFFCIYYILHTLIFGGVLHRLLFVILVAISGTAAGIFYFSKLLRDDNRSFVQAY